MVTMDQWTRREARYLRQALRLTVREFADDIGVSPRTISKWEKAGAARTPRPELQAALDTALTRATPEQLHRFETAVAVGATAPIEPVSEDPPTKPSSSLAGPLSALPHMSIDHLRHVSRLVNEARSHDEAELMPYFADQIEHCQTTDGALGPAAALPAILSVVAALDEIGRQVSVSIRRQLFTLAARSAEFTGWLYRDAGATEHATYWYDRATEWAQVAHNTAMQAYVLLRKSQLAYDQADALRVVTLAEAAEQGPWELPACLHAELAQQQALGLGMLRAPVADVTRQLDRAWQLLGQDVVDDETQLLGAVLTEETLRLRSAVCYTEAHDIERATDLFGQVLATGGLSRRDTGYFTARQAAAFAIGGEPDAAATLALQSLEIANNAQSQRTLRVVADVVNILGPWSDRPSVRSLREAVAP